MAVTIKDIAQVADVSHTTVSRALRGHPAIAAATVERIQNIANELDYVPNSVARSLKESRSGVLGVIVRRIVDPFFARILERKECVQRLQAAAGTPGPKQEAWFQPATALQIYTRVLNNLKILYLRDGDGLSALGCFDRILILTPTAALEYRDRAFLLERLECTRAAIEDYSQYLELAPDHESAAAIRLRRDALAQRKPSLN